MYKKISLCLLLIAIFTSSLFAKDKMPDVINFGFIPTESSSALEKGFSPFMKDMEKYLGIPVKGFFASDYAGIIEGMRFKKVDLAWFGNKSAIEAIDRANGEVFAQTIKSNGSRGYYSHLIVHKDSQITLDDVLKCDQRYIFSNGDPNSTSGFVIPGYYVFAKNGIDPEKCFKKVTSSNHEGNLVAVATKRVDIATNNNESIERLEQTQPELAKNIKVIWTSPLIPADPIVWRKDLPLELKEKIAYFFIQYGRYGDIEKIKREREVLENMGDSWGPFLASSNAQLIEVRKIEAFKNKLKAQAKGDKKGVEESEKIISKLNELSKIYGNGGF
jgi:phosphonate transport system substrate-binding protein